MKPFEDPCALAPGGCDAERWLAYAQHLATLFSREVNGDDLHSHQLDRTFVRVAAVALWPADGRWPCWGQLHVADWLDRMRHWQLWPELRDSAIMSLLAFYTFLVKHGHVTRELARRPMADLEALAAPIIQDMMMGWSTARGASAPN